MAAGKIRPATRVRWASTTGTAVALSAAMSVAMTFALSSMGLSSVCHAQTPTKAPTATAPGAAASSPVQHLRVVGGLAGLSQFTRHEEPFWTRDLPSLSGGRVQAEIVPFDRAGIRGQDMLRLMGLGVVPFGTALLALSTTEVPIAAAADLAGLNPDIATLRRSVAAFRPHLESTLRERHGIELLALYTYPAQVLFCNKPFPDLSGLVGRRVRVSSAAQADLINALGARAVTTGFAEIMPNLRSGNLDCAVTGAMSGHTIGLHEVTTHLHGMAMGWGLAAFGANAGAWQALGPEVQALLRSALPKLEQGIWAESEREAVEGLACNSGAAACRNGKRGAMTLVSSTVDDERRRKQIFADTVLPRWVQRCGAGCAEIWNRTLGPVTGVVAKGL